MSRNYVQLRDGTYYVGTSRVTLDSVILPWLAGRSPESIHQSFPSVPLWGIYGAIAYYLEHQADIDAWLHDTESLWHKQRAEAEAADPEFYVRMRKQFAEARVRLGIEEQENDANAANGGTNAPSEATQESPA